MLLFISLLLKLPTLSLIQMYGQGVNLAKWNQGYTTVICVFEELQIGYLSYKLKVEVWSFEVVIFSLQYASSEIFVRMVESWIGYLMYL